MLRKPGPGLLLRRCSDVPVRDTPAAPSYTRPPAPSSETPPGAAPPLPLAAVQAPYTARGPRPVTLLIFLIGFGVCSSCARHSSPARQLLVLDRPAALLQRLSPAPSVSLGTAPTARDPALRWPSSQLCWLLCPGVCLGHCGQPANPHLCLYNPWRPCLSGTHPSPAHAHGGSGGAAPITEVSPVPWPATGEEPGVQSALSPIRRTEPRSF